MRTRSHWTYVRARLAALAVFTLPFGTFAASEPSSNIDSYAIRVPLTIAPEKPQQRVPLPAEVLVHLKSSNYADVRIFNSQGQPVPLGLARLPARKSTDEKRLELPAYPILGTAKALGVEGLALRIEERKGGRVVELTSGAGSVGSGAGDSQQTLGGLVDTRSIADPVARISLDIDLPKGQPTTLSAYASKDLKSWRRLAETVLYRGEADAGPTVSLGSDSIELGGTDLKDQYVRISWVNPSVALRKVTVVTSRDSFTHERVLAPIATPSMSSPYILDLVLPFTTPISALKLTPKGNNVLVPVRVMGRNDNSQPWKTLANTVVYRISSGDKEQVNGPVELPNGAARELRVEADSKTPGFITPPEIGVLFDAPQIVFLASGSGPFTLAAGQENVKSAHLPLQSLIPGYQADQEFALPAAKLDLAQLKISGSGGIPIAAQTSSDAPPRRTLVLWSILLVGVLLLGGMIWLLVRQLRAAPSSES